MHQQQRQHDAEYLDALAKRHGLRTDGPHMLIERRAHGADGKVRLHTLLGSGGDPCACIVVPIQHPVAHVRPLLGVRRAQKARRIACLGLTAGIQLGIHDRSQRAARVRCQDGHAAHHSLEWHNAKVLVRRRVQQRPEGRRVQEGVQEGTWQRGQ